jgi:hypothetical protein
VGADLGHGLEGIEHAGGERRRHQVRYVGRVEPGDFGCLGGLGRGFGEWSAPETVATTPAFTFL